MENLATLKDALNALVPAANAVSTVQDMNKNEKYQDAYNQTQIQKTNTSNGILSNFGGLFNILIFAAAAYLSWTCNTKCYKNMSVVEKSVRAFFAGFFGIIYLVIYFISWSSDCNKCSENIPVPVSIQSSIMEPTSIQLPSQTIYF